MKNEEIFKSVKNTIEKNNLLQDVTTLGVAVSGGSDSIALLHFLHTTFDGINIVALHVDHCLRGTSERDRLFVEQFCKNNNIKFLYKKVDVKAYCSISGKTIEDGARELRYAFFDECVNGGVVNKVALAHHMGDQAETVLLHILRGSGLTGACGMKVARGNYIRPFLNTSKENILKYIQENNLEYVNDETNFNSVYSRNYIRNEVMPLLRNKFNSVDENICAFANKCLLDENFINEYVEKITLIKTSNNEVKVSLEHFNNEYSIVARLIKKAVNLLDVFQDIETSHISQVINLALNCESGSQLNLPHNIVVYKDYNDVSFVKCLKYNSSCEKINNEILLNFKNNSKIKIKNKNISFKLSDSLEDVKNAKHILDFDKLPKNCFLRTRKNGDIFAKFGSGTKKLKDYFIDKKIENRKRENILLITNSNVVYVVLEYEISNLVKYSSNTKTYLGIYIN